MTRQEIVHELQAARELLRAGQELAADAIVKRVLESVAYDAIDDSRGRHFA